MQVSLTIISIVVLNNLKMTVGVGSECGHLDLLNGTRVDVIHNEPISPQLFNTIFMELKGSSVIITNPNCYIEICGYSVGSYRKDTEFGHCKEFRESMSRISPKELGKNFHMSSLGCGCKKGEESCVISSCAKSQNFIATEVCGILFEESNCGECWNAGIPLDHLGLFETKNSVAVKSIFVRPGCIMKMKTFGAIYIEQPYDYYYYKSVEALLPTFNKAGEVFLCSCPQLLTKSSIDNTLEHSSLPSVTSTMQTNTLVNVISKGMDNITLTNNITTPIPSEISENFSYADLLIPIFGILLLVVGGMVLVIKSNRSRKPSPPILNGSYDPKYEIKRSRIRFDSNDPSSIIGSGAFGVVYKGKLLEKKQLTQVAIKTSRNIDGMALDSLLNEIKVQARLTEGHECPYILFFLGACTSKGQVFIVLEFCEMGSLHSYLKGQKESLAQLPEQSCPNKDTGYTVDPVGTKVKLGQELLNLFVKWSAEIACGMSFLSKKKVIHIDLATRNVLLTKNLKVKISDFGLSRRLYSSPYYKASGNSPMPFKWMALESLEESKYSVKSDIWAYAVTVWEIFTLAKDPYPMITERLQLISHLQSGERLQQPYDATNQMYQEMLRCWHQDPLSRPGFGEMENFFEKLQHHYDTEVIQDN